MTPTLKSKIDELLEAKEKATPGPYRVDIGNWEIESANENCYRAFIARYSPAYSTDPENGPPKDPVATAEYLVAAANLAPQLAREIKNMMEALEDAQSRFLQVQRYVPMGEEHFLTIRTMAHVDEVLARAKKELGCG